METINDLNQEFLNGINHDLKRIEEGYWHIVDYNRYESNAIYHGEYVRTTYIPKIFRRSDFDLFTHDISILFGIFKKVIDHFFDDEHYRSLFGLSELENKLILTGRRDIAYLPMLRVDFFYNEETADYKFCEFNTDGTSAMNEDKELHIAQSRSDAYNIFRQNHHTTTAELFDSWVNTAGEIYKNATGSDEKPHVAIVDYLEYGLVHEFKVFAEHFKELGYSVEICDVRELKYDGTDLTGPAGKKIDVIYRRAVTSDILKNFESSQAMIRAKLDNNVILLGDFQTQIIHNKEIFRMLQHEETYKLLTDTEISYLKKHVPYTKQFTEADKPLVASEPSRWILKPIDSYGSKGIFSGSEYTPEEWPSIVEKVPTEDYIMQEFCTPYVTKNYGDKDGIFGEFDYYNLTGIYVYNGRPVGTYSRVSLTPIISTQYSEKTLPTLIVEDC